MLSELSLSSSDSNLLFELLELFSAFSAILDSSFISAFSAISTSSAYYSGVCSMIFCSFGVWSEWFVFNLSNE